MAAMVCYALKSVITPNYVRIGPIKLDYAAKYGKYELISP